jgi:hypothetical protein
MLHLGVPPQTSSDVMVRARQRPDAAEVHHSLPTASLLHTEYADNARRQLRQFERVLSLCDKFGTLRKNEMS